MAALPSRYQRERLGPHLTRLDDQDHYFYLLNEGNAVNFAHGAWVGPFIFLVQGEILVAAASLANRTVTPGIHEVGDQGRATLARLWLQLFNER